MVACISTPRYGFLFVHLPVDGHLGCFPNMDDDAVNICLYLWTCFHFFWDGTPSGIFCLFILLQLSQFFPFAPSLPSLLLSLTLKSLSLVHESFIHILWLVPSPNSPPPPPTAVSLFHVTLSPVLFFSWNLCSLDFSYKWGHVVFVFHCLAYFT